MEETPFNCGHFLASHMLRSAMGKTAQPLLLGLYIMQPPSDDWCLALKHAVRDVYLGGQGRDRERRVVGSGLPHLRVFELPSTADRKQAEQLTPSVQEALALDQTVIVITGNLHLAGVVRELVMEHKMTAAHHRRLWCTPASAGYQLNCQMPPVASGQLSNGYPCLVSLR